MKSLKMTSVHQFLAKLQSVNWHTIEGKNVIGTLHGKEVTLQMTLNLKAIAELTIQPVVHVKIDNFVVASWGATSESDSNTIVTFVMQAKAKADYNERASESTKRASAELFYESIAI